MMFEKDFQVTPISIKIIVLIVIMIFISYLFFDIPFAIYSSSHNLKRFYIFHVLVSIHPILMWVSLLGIFLGLALYNKYKTFSLQILACSLSVAIAEFFIEVLKKFFGRYWISTYINDNPSLLKNNIYGFSWFHGTLENSSFPSGNIALISAAMIMLSRFYPKFRFLFFIFIGLDMVTMFGLNYHFISDMLGGIIVGYISTFIIGRILFDM